MVNEASVRESSTIKSQAFLQERAAYRNIPDRHDWSLNGSSWSSVSNTG